MHGGSLEITLTVPLRLNNDDMFLIVPFTTFVVMSLVLLWVMVGGLDSLVFSIWRFSHRGWNKNMKLRLVHRWSSRFGSLFRKKILNFPTFPNYIMLKFALYNF